MVDGRNAFAEMSRRGDGMPDSIDRLTADRWKIGVPERQEAGDRGRQGASAAMLVAPLDPWCLQYHGLFACFRKPVHHPISGSPCLYQ
jgi:hypothetical protein